MTTTPRPVVLVVEPMVLAAWAVVDALAGATVLVVEARQAVRRRASRRSGTTAPRAGAAARARTTPCPEVIAPARTFHGSLTV